MQNKFSEAQKTGIELRIELEKNPIDREKILELREKHNALMKEISDWEFDRELNRMR